MENIMLSKLDFDECSRYLGYKGIKPDANIFEMMKECEEQLVKMAVPRFLYKCFDISKYENGILIKNTDIVLTGESICTHLNGCTRIAIIAATLSVQTDRLIRKYSAYDMTKAVIIDALATVAIEQLCDNIELVVKEKEAVKDLTSRFGFGYGDLPIQLENDVLSLINATKEIGLCISDSYVLMPQKSVLCIVGLGKKDMYRKSCDNCNLKGKCQYNRRGESCGI